MSNSRRTNSCSCSTAPAADRNRASALLKSPGNGVISVPVPGVRGSVVIRSLSSAQALRRCAGSGSSPWPASCVDQQRSTRARPLGAMKRSVGHHLTGQVAAATLSRPPIWAWPACDPPRLPDRRADRRRDRRPCRLLRGGTRRRPDRRRRDRSRSVVRTQTARPLALDCGNECRNGRRPRRRCSARRLRHQPR